MANPADYQSLLGKRPDADGHVQVLLDQIEVAIGEHQLGADAGVGFDESLHERSNVQAAEQNWRRDSQETVQGCIPLLLGHVDGLLVVFQQLPGARS